MWKLYEVFLLLLVHTLWDYEYFLYMVVTCLNMAGYKDSKIPFSKGYLKI